MVRPLQPLMETWSASAETGTWSACERDGMGVCRAPKGTSQRGTSQKDKYQNWRSPKVQKTRPLSHIGVALTSQGHQKAPEIPHVRHLHSLTDCQSAAALSDPERPQDWWSGLGTPAGLLAMREEQRSGLGMEVLRRFQVVLRGSTDPAEAVNPVVPNLEEIQSQTLTCTERNP